MVDDHTQRPFLRSSETVARGAPAKTPSQSSSPSGNDPLAELARLIGQNDPFSEFGRDGVRRVAAPQASEPAQDRPQDRAHDWDAQPEPEPEVQPQNFAPTFGRQQFGSAPLSSGNDLYRVDNEGHPATYDDDRYDPNNPALGTEHDDFYDDEPPSRRRMGILVIAGVFALAVIGTAGAFGYRALFGGSSTSGPPPVIKADSAPIKIVPASTQPGKQITDRVNDKGIGEKLVSREEQPVPVSPQQDPNQSMPQPAMGSGIIGSEPKKVRTIAIRPDGSSDAPQASAPPPPQQPQRAVAPTPALAPAPVPAKPAAPPPRVVATAPSAAAQDPEPVPAPRAPAARPAPPAQQAAAPAAGNAPLSLSPDAAPARPAPARPAPAHTATAAAPAAPAAAASGGYAVQVSAQRSEAEAQAAFRSLQSKYPGQLGGKQPVIARVDLGDKGIYYRAMVPSASGSEASELCTSLKAAGGSCIVQRN